MKKLIVIALMVLPVIADAQLRKVNYDEGKVGPYTLEDPLRFADGSKVRTRKDWTRRREEILELFQKEMYGRMPPESEIWLEELEQGPTLAGFGTRKQVRMWFKADRTGPSIDWLIVLPAKAKGPVPAVICLNYHGNHTIMPDEEILCPEDAWLRDNREYSETGHRANPSNRGMLAGQNTSTVYPLGTILSRGYAFVTACYGDISPDPSEPALQDEIAYTDIFELWGRRDDSREDNTTSLCAWAWALCRGLDMLEREPAVDASKVVVTGCSRLGKAALLAGAFDTRFPVVAPVQTGGGGVPLAKRDFGENISTETASFTHWYCKAYGKYAGNEDRMPFDQHLFISCVAPRALLVEGFDEKWFDTKGEYLSVKAASPVWERFTGSGLPQTSFPDDYDTSAIGDRLGYVRRDLKHGISACDWTWMLDFADRNLKGRD